MALVRASDFYGPGVKNAGLGDLVFPHLLKASGVYICVGFVLCVTCCLFFFWYHPRSQLRKVQAAVQRSIPRWFPLQRYRIWSVVTSFTKTFQVTLL